MNTYIYSREAIETYLKRNSPENIVVISFCDTENSCAEDYLPPDFTDKVGKFMQIRLDDIDSGGIKKRGLAYKDYFPEAEELAGFIYEAHHAGLNIICQCEDGVSRSTGCAAAIEEHFDKNGISVFLNTIYSPNKLIYRKVFDALQDYKDKCDNEIIKNIIEKDIKFSDAFKKLREVDMPIRKLCLTTFPSMVLQQGRIDRLGQLLKMKYSDLKKLTDDHRLSLSLPDIVGALYELNEEGWL